VWRTVFHERDLTLEQGKSVRSSCPWGQGAAETCDELTVTPIPHPPVLVGGVGGGREKGVKLSLGRREGVFKVWIYFCI